jgi:hypothetical protein
MIADAVHPFHIATSSRAKYAFTGPDAAALSMKGLSYDCAAESDGRDVAHGATKPNREQGP